MGKSATDDRETELVQIAEMYDESAPMSDAFNDGQVHLAYWYDDDDSAPITEASQRITRKVADSLGLRHGERVLDVGSGLGAPAIQLAREYGVRVTGINISNRQVTGAQARAGSSGVAEQVQFQYGDYNSLDFADDSFDAVVAMETLLYAPDLGHALAGLHRVLRPGGRLALTETTREGLSVEEANKVAAGFNAKWLMSVPEWIAPLRAAGFEFLEYVQCGPRVFGMGPKYVHAAESQRDQLAARFGDGAVDELKQALQFYFAPGAQQIGYAIITVRKPRR